MHRINDARAVELVKNGIKDQYMLLQVICLFLRASERPCGSRPKLSLFGNSTPVAFDYGIIYSALLGRFHSGMLQRMR